MRGETPQISRLVQESAFGDASSSRKRKILRVACKSRVFRARPGGANRGNLGNPYGRQGGGRWVLRQPVAPAGRTSAHEKFLGALVQVPPTGDGAGGLAIRPWRLKRGSSASRVSEARAFPCDQFSLEGKAPPNPTGVYNPRHCKTAGKTAQNPANCTTVCQKAGKFPATGAVLRFAESSIPVAQRRFAGSAAETSALCDCRLSKPLKRARKRESPFAFSSSPTACRAGRFLRREVPFPRAKVGSMQFSRPEIRRILEETGKGGQRRGILRFHQRQNCRGSN